MEKTLITRGRIISFQHYNLPSLMAGKVHALITRKYWKGRDWYDLIWYKGLRPAIEPNLKLLQNALDQTQGKGVFNARDWEQILSLKLEQLDCIMLKEDIYPFLEHPEEADFFTLENFQSILNT